MTFLLIGDPAPWFTAASSSNPNYNFDTVGGYRIILCFLGCFNLNPYAKVLQDFAALQPQLEQYQIPFFAVTIDAQDVDFQRLIKIPSYFKLVWDFDQSVSKLYGLLQESEANTSYSPTTFVLDENLRILQVFHMNSPQNHANQVLEFIKNLPVAEPPALAERQAPVLLIPNVFSPDFCKYLIHLYETDGGHDSGFMQQIDGKTVEVLDPKFKQRRDFNITDSVQLQAVNDLVLRRVKPEIEKAFQFSITRFERYLVACYDASKGFFNRHRDNTTKGTAHRRFAMTINLNRGEYSGGCLRFPEYGNRLYRPQIGEAIIFSCSLLHEVTPVTIGTRFALLSFFYNESDAQVRARNQKYIATNSAIQATSSMQQNSEVNTLGFQSKSFKKHPKKNGKYK